MATLGICSYCQKPATKTCTMCGKAICTEHEEPDQVNVCAQCAQGGVMA